MDENKNWQQPNQQPQQSPQIQSQFGQQATSQSTPTFPAANFGSYSNWTLPNQTTPPLYPFDPRYYHQWFQQQCQQQQQFQSSNNSPVPSPQAPSVPQQPNMTPFLPYPFPNPLQYPPFSPISTSTSPNVATAQSTPVIQFQPNTPTTTIERKRPRITYTPDQVKFLEVWYKKNQFISTSERSQISEVLKVDPAQIRIWFQNRRARDRRRVHQTSDSPKSTSSAGSGPGSAYSGSVASDSSYNASPLTLSNDSGLGLNLSSMPNNSPFSTLNMNAFGQNTNQMSMLSMMHYNQPAPQPNNMMPPNENKQNVPQPSDFDMQVKPEEK